MAKKLPIKPDGIKIGASVAKGNKTRIIAAPEISSKAMEQWKAVEDTKVSRIIQTAHFKPKKII